MTKNRCASTKCRGCRMVNLVMVRIADVAREAGVAYSTASLALRGVARVAPATRQRVLAVAEQLGYSPNAAAALLASQRRQGRHQANQINLAFLTPHFSYHEQSASSGVHSAASRLGYGVLTPYLDQTTDFSQLARRLYQSGVEGIMINARHAWSGFDWRQFEFDRFCVVKIGRGLSDVSATTVCVNVSEMTRLALRKIYEAGYRSVFCLLSISPSEADNDARIGTVYSFRHRLLQAGCRLEWLEIPLHNKQLLAKALESMRKARTEAVLAFPAGFHGNLKDAGVMIPESMAYAAMPVVPWNDPKALVAGVDARDVDQGTHAVDLLHQLIILRKRGLQENFDQTHLRPLWRAGLSLPTRQPVAG